MKNNNFFKRWRGNYCLPLAKGSSSHDEIVSKNAEGMCALLCHYNTWSVGRKKLMNPILIICTGAVWVDAVFICLWGPVSLRCSCQGRSFPLIISTCLCRFLNVQLVLVTYPVKIHEVILIRWKKSNEAESGPRDGFFCMFERRLRLFKKDFRRKRRHFGQRSN